MKEGENSELLKKRKIWNPIARRTKATEAKYQNNLIINHLIEDEFDLQSKHIGTYMDKLLERFPKLERQSVRRLLENFFVNMHLKLQKGECINLTSSITDTKLWIIKDNYKKHNRRQQTNIRRNKKKIKEKLGGIMSGLLAFKQVDTEEDRIKRIEDSIKSKMYYIKKIIKENG